MKMKKLLWLLLFLSYGCSHEASRPEAAGTRGGGRSLPVYLTGHLYKESPAGAVFLFPKDEEEGWTKEERRCVAKLYNALELSGFHRAASKDAAALRVSVEFPPATQATGFNFTALFGGYHHELRLSAARADGKTAWDIQAFLNYEQNQRSEICAHLAVALVGNFGRAIPDTETVHVSENDSRMEAINAESVARQPLQ